MGRRERRGQMKLQREQNKANELWLSRQKHLRDKDVINEALEETEEFVKHYYTGKMYTVLALLLRAHPYRWPADKVMRLLEKTQSTIHAIEDGSYSVEQLIADAESWGIRVKWGTQKGRKHINDLNIFEEEEG